MGATHLDGKHGIDKGAVTALYLEATIDLNFYFLCMGGMRRSDHFPWRRAHGELFNPAKKWPQLWKSHAIS